ncbi:MAG: tetratricopeptide repeat protein, partial [Planctomycetota bacterium]
MSDKIHGDAPADAGAFFEKARRAAQTHHFDQAINLYLEGLQCDPEAVEQGHVELRELALKRLAKGGRKPSAQEAAERGSAQTALEQMINAEYLLAKDPGHLPYAEALLKAAVAGDYKHAAKWMADLMFLANNNARKPSRHVYVILKDAYEAIGQLKRAVSACRRAVKLRPQDKHLVAEFKRLSEDLADSSLETHHEVASAGISQKNADLNAGDLGEVPGRTVSSVMPGQIDPMLARARDAFNKAQQVAQVNDFDYAIDLYLKGLRSMPDSLEEGHLALCDLALKRKRKGGKKPSMMERVKFMRGKTPLEQMLNAEHLFAKDPDNLSYAEAMLKGAVAGGYIKTANWIANYIFQGNNAADKPSFHTYMMLKDCYAALGQYDRALAACQCAARMKPNDETVADELKNLTAEVTVARGRYDQEGDFRKAIKDREQQEKLHAQESVVKTRDWRVTAVEDARKALAREPHLAKNVYNLANALADLETEEAENEAIELLEQTYRTKKDFSFKQRAGLARIKQVKRKIREAKEILETSPDDPQTNARLTELTGQLNDVELEHYHLCVENYPTDLQAKYEYALRLVRKEKYDDAIPLFQESQKDPRHKIAAMDKIGLCFFMKGWFT